MQGKAVFSRSFQNPFSISSISSQHKTQTRRPASVFLIRLLFPQAYRLDAREAFFIIYPLLFSHTYTTPVSSCEACLIHPLTPFSCSLYSHPSGLL